MSGYIFLPTLYDIGLQKIFLYNIGGNMYVVEEKTLVSRGWKYKQLRLEQEKKHKQLSFIKENKEVRKCK